MIPHGWRAAFIDSTRRVVLSKPGYRQPRRVYLKFDAFGMRRIDKHGNYCNDDICPIAPETKDEVLAMCRERWG